MAVVVLMFLASYSFSQSDAYLKCRCGQANFAPATISQCCGYGVMPPGHSTSECCPAITCTAKAGGYVKNGPSVATDCTACCGSGYQGIPGSVATCNGVSYNSCTCKATTPAATLVANIQMVNQTGGCLNTNVMSVFGFTGSTILAQRCPNGANPHSTMPGDTAASECMTAWGTTISQYLNANQGGFQNICYVGNDTTASECYYLACKVVVQ